MYQKLIIAGNLTRDIEMRYAQSGSAIASTAIATTRKFKGADGSKKEETLFIDITFFGRSAEIANQFLRKGSKILVDGRLKLDQWAAQDGSKKSKHSVVVENMTMLGGKEDGQGQQQPQQGGYSQPQAQQPNPTTYRQPESAVEVPSDDEIPF